jgi:threonylcarbamoyladenosine tRNA methylthiotransferase CDKAL1
MKRVYSEVYGCPSNIADCEMTLGLLKQNGFEIADSPEKADLNIIFTCIVKTPTEQRMIRRIQELVKLGNPLIVAGCMPKVEQRVIEGIAPNASMLGPKSIDRIVDAAKDTLNGEKVILTTDSQKPKLCMPRVRKNEKVGIVEISNGCLSSCIYCIVKFARGRLQSYPVENIVEEVQSAVDNECTEIWLTSQDNGCYGLDIGNNLPKLLNEVCKVPGDFTIRVGMMNPTHAKGMIDELIEAYKNEKVQKFLHLPVQSGSDSVLEAMRRGYTIEDFADIVKKFRETFPNLTLSTDIIVGFPTESDEDFQATLDLLEKLRPQKVNISKFGARPGTDAARMERLSVETVNERSRTVHKLVISS